MKPLDKDGHTLYPKCFNVLKRYGEALEEMGWEEASKKPNLFFKKIAGVAVFADMRGTEIVPIWEEPCPMIYTDKKHPSWMKRRAAILACQELDDYPEFSIPYRFSFYDVFESGGLVSGDNYGLTAKGFCHNCDKMLNDDRLFCSEECSRSYKPRESSDVEDEFYPLMRKKERQRGKRLGYYPQAPRYQGILLANGYSQSSNIDVFYIRAGPRIIFADFRDLEGNPAWSRYGAPVFSSLSLKVGSTKEIENPQDHLNRLKRAGILEMSAEHFYGIECGICNKCGNPFDGEGYLCPSCLDAIYRCPFCHKSVRRIQFVDIEKDDFYPDEFSLLNKEDFYWLLSKYCPDHADKLLKRDLALKMNTSANCQICGVKVVEKGYLSNENKETIKKLMGMDVEIREDHHTSYNPEKTIIVCQVCHKKIHHSNDPNLVVFKPATKRPKRIENVKKKRRKTSTNTWYIEDF